jgi:ActR/RegA family two-component response regulator
MKKTNFAGSPIGIAAEATWPAGARLQAKPRQPGTGILLVSGDSAFGAKLEFAGERARRPVVRVAGVSEARRAMEAIRPAAMLVDLDLKDETACPSTDAFFDDEFCPVVILLTSRNELASSMAVRLGALAPKVLSPEHLLEMVDRALAERATQVNRNAVPRALVRLLSPCLSQIPPAPPARIRRYYE